MNKLKELWRRWYPPKPARLIDVERVHVRVYLDHKESIDLTYEGYWLESDCFGPWVVTGSMLAERDMEAAPYFFSHNGRRISTRWIRSWEIVSKEELLRPAAPIDRRP